MALSYSQAKSGNTSSGSSRGSLTYAKAKKSAEPYLESIKKSLTERDTVQKRADDFKRNYENAIEQARVAAEEAQKAVAKRDFWENIKSFPKEVVKAGVIRPAISLAEIPKNIYGVSTGKQDTFGPVDIPGFGPVESYQSSAKRVAGDVVEGKASLGQFAGEFAQAPIDIASTFYAPAKAGLGALGVIRGGKTLEGIVSASKAVVPAMSAQFAADAAKEGKSASEVAWESVKGAGVGIATAAGFGIGGLAVRGLAKGIEKFFRKDATVQEQILVKQAEVQNNPEKFIQEQAGKPKDPLTFISTRKDLEIVPANPTQDASGNIIGTHLVWDDASKTGKLYITPDAKPDAIAQEIGNYIEKKFSELSKSSTFENIIKKEIPAVVKGENTTIADAVREILMNPNKATKAPVLVKSIEDAGLDVPGIIGRSARENYGESKILKRANERLPEELQLDTRYEKTSNKALINEASQLAQEDVNKAVSRAYGMNGTEAEQQAAAVYLKEAALEKGDIASFVDLTQTLARRATRFGQASSVLQADAGGPINTFMRRLMKTKLDVANFPSDLKKIAIEKLKKRGIDKPTRTEIAREAVTEEAKTVSARIKKNRMNVKNAQSLIDKLTC